MKIAITRVNKELKNPKSDYLSMAVADLTIHYYLFPLMANPNHTNKANLKRDLIIALTLDGTIRMLVLKVLNDVEKILEIKISIEENNKIVSGVTRYLKANDVASLVDKIYISHKVLGKLRH
jgi:hypothetical protein